MADVAVAERPTTEADVKGKPAEQRPTEKPAEQKPSEKPAEQKPAEQKPDAPAAEPERKDGAPTAEKPKPPEKYALTVPAGSRVDADNLAFVERIAKTAGWSNEDAQAAVDEIHTLFDEEIQKYAAEARADRDYGGDQFELTDRRARFVIDRIRPQGHPRREAFLRFLNKGGAFNNIEALSFLADLGKAMGEDAPASGVSGLKPAGFEAAEFFNHPTSAKYRT